MKSLAPIFLFFGIALSPAAVAQVSSAGTWLPVKGATQLPENDLSAKAADAFLKSLSCRLRPLICSYEGSKLAASFPVIGGKAEAAGQKWDCALKTAPVAKMPEALDVMATFTLREGEAKEGGIALAMDFSNWDSANYVLLPACVYDGNRNRIVNRGWFQGLDESDYHRKDLPQSHGETPRLEIDPAKPSKLEVLASNSTTPTVCVWDRAAKRGFIVLAEQGGRGAAGDFLRHAGSDEVHDNGFSVEESADRKQASIVVSAPGVRERFPMFVGFAACRDRGMALKTGDVISLKLRVLNFQAQDIPAVLERLMTARKDVTGPNHPRALFPASVAEKLQVARIDAYYQDAAKRGGKLSYYPGDAGYPDLYFGWIGGLMNTFPMLAQGDEVHLQKVAETFNSGLHGQMKSGYFHGWIDRNGTPRLHSAGGGFASHTTFAMTRTNGDVLFWMMKQFALLRAQGRGAAIKPEWEASMKRLADAFVKTWKDCGQWGKFIDVETGEVVEYNTTGGAMAVGGLALASKYFKNPEYLALAKKAADFFYERDFVKRGETFGGCADILQNADSETAAGFMTSLMALYEVTGEPQWLEKSRNAANLAATWVVSYDYELPKATAHGGRGTKFTGTVWASTQNKHGAPGFCTSSGDPLFKIYRATGDVRYADLMRDVIDAHRESIRPNGSNNERLNYCDAGARGEVIWSFENLWTELNGVLMCEEVPGIYVRTDMDRFYVFDSVEAKVISREAGKVKLEITNRTPHDAQVSVLAEDAEAAKKTSGYTSFIRWPKVGVKAGETRVVEVKAGSVGIPGASLSK